MAESINISRLRGPSTLLHYGLSVLAVSAATIVQQFGDKHFAVTPSYFCAVLLTAWLGGWGPALFAIALLCIIFAADPDIRHRRQIRILSHPVFTRGPICYMAQRQRAPHYEVTWLRTQPA